MAPQRGSSGAPRGDQQSRLGGSLGPVAIIFMVVAAAAPMTTVGATVPVAIQLANGPAFPAMYLITAVVLGLFAVGFVAMTPHVPRAGAFYSYNACGLGDRVGMGAAYLALLTYTTVQVAVHAFMGVIANDLVSLYGGPDLGWFVWSMISVAVVGVLGYRHIDLSSKVLGLVLICEIGLCGALALVALLKGGPEGHSSAMFNLSDLTAGSPGLGLMFAISGFIGFEATAIFRDEARDSSRTVPRATYGALTLIGVFYAFVAWAIITAWGDSGAVERASRHSETMLPDTATRVLGSGFGEMFQWVMVGSIFACVLSFHNVIARYLFTLGNNNWLPKSLGRKHSSHASPHVGSLTQSASAVLLLAASLAFGMDPVSQIFTWFLGVATVGVLVLMVMTSIAVLAFFARNNVDSRVWNTRVAPSLGLIGLGVTLIITVMNFPVLMGSMTLGLIASGVIALTFFAGYIRTPVQESSGTNPPVSPHGSHGALRMTDAETAQITPPAGT